MQPLPGMRVPLLKSALAALAMALLVTHGSGLGAPAWDPHFTVRHDTVTTLTPDNDLVLSWGDGTNYYYERRNFTDINDVAWSVSTPKHHVEYLPDGAYTDPKYNLMYIRIWGHTTDGWGTPVKPHRVNFVSVSDGQLVTNTISNQQFYHVGGGGHSWPILDVHPTICVDQVFWYGWYGLPSDTKPEIYRYDRLSQAYVNRFQDSTTYTGTYISLTPLRRNVEGVACPVISTSVTAISHFFAVFSNGQPGSTNWLMKMNLDYEVEYEVQMPPNCQVQRIFSSEVFTHENGEHLLLIPRKCNSRMGAWAVFASNGTVAWSYSSPVAVSSDVVTAEIEPVTGNAIILGKANGDIDDAGPETHMGNWDAVVMMLRHQDGALLALRQLGTEWEDRPRELLFRSNYKDIFICFDAFVGGTASSFKGKALTPSQARSIVTHVGLGSCPTGSYITGFLGSVVCSMCPPGTYQDNVDSLSCFPCPAGTTSTVGSTVCEPCSPGTYADNEGSSECTPCPRGKYSLVTGATACFSCLQGTYTSVQSGATTCTACPVGTYQNEIESGECKQCPPGSTTRGSLASLVTMCECEEGYFGDMSTLSASSGLDSACQKCPSHTKCTMGTLHPKPEPGFWISPTNGMAVFACMPPSSCSSSNGGDGSSCSQGYRGDSCNNCAEGYYRQGMFCYACPSVARFEANTSAVLMGLLYSVVISTGITAAALGASLNKGIVSTRSPRDCFHIGIHIQRFIHAHAVVFPGFVFSMQLVSIAVVLPLALPRSLDWFAASARLYTFQVENIFPNECAFSWTESNRAEIRQWLFVFRQLLPYVVFLFLVPMCLVVCGPVGLACNALLRPRQCGRAGRDFLVLLVAKYLRAFDLAYFAFHLATMTAFACFEYSDGTFVLLNEVALSCSSSQPAVVTSYTIAVVTLPLVSLGYPICLTILHAVAAISRRTALVPSEKTRSIIAHIEGEVSPHFGEGQRYWHSIHTWERFFLGVLLCSGLFSLTDSHMYLLVGFIGLFLLYVAAWPYLHPDQDCAYALARLVSIVVLAYGLFDMLTGSNGLSGAGSMFLEIFLLILVYTYMVATSILWVKCLVYQYARSCGLPFGKRYIDRADAVDIKSNAPESKHDAYDNLVQSASVSTTDEEDTPHHSHKFANSPNKPAEFRGIVMDWNEEKYTSRVQPKTLTMAQKDALQRFKEQKAALKGRYKAAL